MISSTPATRETEIGGRAFTVTQLPAMRAASLFNRLCRTFIPGMLRAFGGSAGTGKIKLADVLSASTSALADGAQEVLGRLTPEEQESLLRGLLGNARMKNEAGEWIELAPAIDEVFRGRVEQLFQLAFFALRVNYEGFFGALNAAIGAASSKAAEVPPPKGD